jgi:hypothetical protein
MIPTNNHYENLFEGLYTQYRYNVNGRNSEISDIIDILIRMLKLIKDNNRFLFSKIQATIANKN